MITRACVQYMELTRIAGGALRILPMDSQGVI
jgi:hypothetical protein